MDEKEQSKFHERIAILEEKGSYYEISINEIKIDIKDIKNKLLGRPSWATMMIITSLTSVIAILATYILSNLNMSI
jgi:hypothetical protein